MKNPLKTCHVAKPEGEIIVKVATYPYRTYKSAQSRADRYIKNLLARCRNPIDSFGFCGDEDGTDNPRDPIYYCYRYKIVAVKDRANATV